MPDSSDNRMVQSDDLIYLWCPKCGSKGAPKLDKWAECCILCDPRHRRSPSSNGVTRATHTNSQINGANNA